MKVQAKLLSDHYQYEVVEESSNYYIVYGTGGKVAVSKADYEPVQEWVDVTHTVKFGTYSGLRDCRDSDRIVDSELNGMGYILAGEYGCSVTLAGMWQQRFKMELVNGAIRVYERKTA